MKFQIIAGELSLDFINTLDNRPTPERRQELLPTYADLAAWAGQAGAISAALRVRLLREAEAHPGLADTVLKKAIDLRECLYRVVSARLRKRRVAADDLRVFSGHLSDAFSHLQLRPSRNGFHLQWADDHPRLDAVLWPIVRSASGLLTGHDLKYVRECSSKSCRWLFVDRSKNHSRHWCDMKLCGNRMKARKFYRRQQKAG